ncbi:MAG: hypothetical protein K2P81_01680 [Bacteriovoracaceae bacterium]|nr:hypothetical protein [Bacteriovoracaceae bacterium]
MKLILFIALSLTSFSVFARQYTQCSSDGLYSVVNLPSEVKGTLFLTAGAETDDRMLADIELMDTEEGQHIYKVLNAPFEGLVFFPSNALGKNLNNINVILKADSVTYDFSCFTRIYEE